MGRFPRRTYLRKRLASAVGTIRQIMLSHQRLDQAFGRNGIDNLPGPTPTTRADGCLTAISAYFPFGRKNRWLRNIQQPIETLSFNGFDVSGR
jgi:hypothetical protein